MIIIANYTTYNQKLWSYFWVVKVPIRYKNKLKFTGIMVQQWWILYACMNEISLNISHRTVQHSTRRSWSSKWPLTIQIQWKFVKTFSEYADIWARHHNNSQEHLVLSGSVLCRWPLGRFSYRSAAVFTSTEYKEEIGFFKPTSTSIMQAPLRQILHKMCV